MKQVTILVIALLVLVKAESQNIPADYANWVKRADSLYAAGNFSSSAEAYRTGFSFLGGKAYPKDRYNAACSYALAGMPDSAFKHLTSLYNKTVYLKSDFLLTDKDFNSIHGDKRWKKLVRDLKKREKTESKHHDKKLIAQLNDIYTEDQKYRQMVDSVRGKFGKDSEEMKSLWKTMARVDSLNLIEVKKILDKHGWLGPEVITSKGSSTLFLVIQHSDLQTQEKYLPMMREAAKNGKASLSDLALLEDRVLLGQGKKQKYGSQIGYDKEDDRNYVLPLEDPINVDKRRAEVNLGPMSDYVAHWGLVWNPEAYIKEMEEREKK